MVAKRKPYRLPQMHHNWGADLRRKRKRGEGRALVLKIGQLTVLVSAPRGKDDR